MRKFVSGAVSGAVITCLLYAAPCAAGPLQDRIAAAGPGDVIELPAGAYDGPVTLKDGMTLVGAGADSTFIDGQGAKYVVTMGKDAALIGVTVRNGERGIWNDGAGFGVFECRIGSDLLTGILMNHGFAVIANNLIVGNRRSTGISCYGSNPYIQNNVIARHLTGLRASKHFMPALVGNTFVDNRFAVRVSSETVLFTDGNVFDRNAENMIGQPLGETDAVRPVEGGLELPARGGAVAEYRTLMAMVGREKVAEHPVVVYTLDGDMGQFGMATLYPWATFTVGASTPDTRVDAFQALDLATAAILKSEYRALSRPTLVVSNPEITELEDERFALDTLFRHPDSYFRDDEGRLHFKRLTTFSQIEILIPEGFIPIAANAGMDFRWAGGRVLARLRDVGRTEIDLVLTENAEGVDDPLGVRALKTDTATP